MNRFAQALSTIVALAVSAVTQHARAVTIEMVPVGNPGNAGEWHSYGAVGPASYGAVPYSYRIGKYEVTNAQYVEFLNGVDPTGANTLTLYNSSMTSYPIDVGGINFNSGAANGAKYEIKPGHANNPVVFVSWYDSIRFANWLHNGQGNGDTETGAYTLGALGSGGVPLNGSSITRSPGARWWLPSDNEWHKAAYHKNDGVTGNYWEYPTSTDVVPYSDQPPGSHALDQSNSANFQKNDQIVNGYNDGYAVTGSSTLAISQNYLTDVGAYTLSTSPYGTFDQGGNVWEWIESLSGFGSDRVLRGASWLSGRSPYMSASYQSTNYPGGEGESIGFRVATIPEPSTILLFGFGATVALVMRRRFARTQRLLAAAIVASLAVQVTIANAVTIQTVPIDNPGNSADTRYIESAHPSGVGSVAYPFRMGKTEVTNAQYVVFLNAVAASDPYGLYSTGMGSSPWGGIDRSGSSGSFTYSTKAPALGGDYTYDNKPVVFVNFGDALRFANWLHNGQPNGLEDATTTEGGAYALNGAVTDAALAAITRNSGARWWLPSENEWYKAAYHKNDGVTGNYWEYPTGTDSVPNNHQPSFDTGNSANFNYDNHYTTSDGFYPMTDAAAYTLSESPYGTFDQAGNVLEWNETIFDDPFSGQSGRAVRGGSWSLESVDLRAFTWSAGDPTGESLDLGFRVATIPDLPGDFNHDGTVDAADYVVWRKTGGSPDDYNTWQTNFARTLFTGGGSGATGSASAPAIPEPASLHLLLLTALAAYIVHRSRSSPSPCLPLSTPPLFRRLAKNRC